ncbi:spermidine synthase [Natronococcus occultus]|uniref:Spermidine synthase n=1 Tax=Natronococcus occultus SP4 TaxID=694430 RepID=L0K060_9EURY|nr:fused MFS/spermidine synthase [Natronococcus occultus]AGB37739.1 spermidine synthase [Natronococcus occultus SP4]
MRNALPDYRPTKPELAVFVSGITSMGLEILAVRIVAPQFGSHIYTVGGILTVLLAALSLGYWQGGKRASLATLREMSWLMLATAVYVAVVIYASDFLLAYTSTLAIPPRYASLPAVIILFGPPTYLLGFISPYAAELSRKRGIGEASGHVYALGTIGSILGSGATTFVLIPYLSIAQIGLLFGIVLVATALALELPSLPRNPTIASVVVVLLLVTAAGGGPVDFDHRGDVIHESQTPHQHLEVVDDDEIRTMYLDGARHSAMDLEDPDRHVFAYTKYFHLPMLTVDDHEDVDDVLFIGGGGYTGPQDFEERYDVDVDVVEIDPEVTEAAEEYFGLEHGEEMTSYATDGRQFLQNADEEYDVIVLDAYKQDQVPFHMTTAEFMELTADRLSDDGVLLANVVSAPSGSASEFYRAEYATMEEAFPEVYSFRTSDEDSVQNIQLVATTDSETLSQGDLEQRNEERELGVDLSDEVDHYMADPETDDVPVLRDDRAPVDSLLDPMLGQRYVIEETESSEPTTANPAIAPVST